MIVADLNVSVVAYRDAIALDALVAAYASGRRGGNQEDGKGEQEAHGSVFSLVSIGQLLRVIIGVLEIVENMFPQVIFRAMAPLIFCSCPRAARLRKGRGGIFEAPGS